MRGFVVRAFVLGLALATAVLPLPSRWVERYYSTGFYPPVQQGLTGLSNRTPVALFDGLLAVLILALLVLLVRRRRIRNVLTLLACVWLAFSVTWGLNYRRVPLGDRLARAEEPPSREVRADAFLRMAVAELNGLAPVAHAQSWPAFDELSVTLVPAFRTVQRELGLSGEAVPGRPKTSALTPFFRLAAVDGFTDPFLLETIVHPEVLPVERPHVLAHEWGHLVGLADESEASLFAWLVCLRAGPQERYSGWLALYPRLAGAVPRGRSQEIRAGLAQRVRDDLAAITARLRGASPAVRQATEVIYDRYLRANRVDLGIASYDAVVTLLVMTEFTPELVPRLRP